MRRLFSVIVHALAVVGLVTLIANCEHTVVKLGQPQAEDESRITLDGWDAGQLTT